MESGCFSLDLRPIGGLVDFYCGHRICAVSWSPHSRIYGIIKTRRGGRGYRERGRGQRGEERWERGRGRGERKEGRGLIPFIIDSDLLLLHNTSVLQFLAYGLTVIVPLTVSSPLPYYFVLFY